jgi:plasmid replication initiation protein
LDREQLEALAELIAFRLRQAREDRAPDERRRLVTARQAAELPAVDLKTVYRHAKALGGRKVGGAWRFDLDAEAVEDPGARALATQARGRNPLNR